MELDPETPQAEVLKSSEGETLYRYSIVLTEDEESAIRAFGLNPGSEILSHTKWRARALIDGFCEAYVQKCFREGKPLDCVCKKTLLRRHLADIATSKQ